MTALIVIAAGVWWCAITLSWIGFQLAYMNARADGDRREMNRR